MRARRLDWTLVRAVVAVTALYAFALQAVLGGAARAGFSDATNSLCLQVAGSLDGGPIEHPPLDCKGCCTAAHHFPTIGDPASPSISLHWPLGSAVRLAWRAEVVAAPRAPPYTRPRVRAPPVV